MASRSEKHEVKIDGEYVLTDAIHIIFQYLSIEDLRSAALVNRSWYNRALRERLTRGLRIIPVYAANVYSRKFRTREPRVTFFFGEKKEFGQEQPLVRRYMNRFENYMVHFRTDVVKLNDKSVVNEDAVSLVIPEYRDLKIRFTLFSIYSDGTGFIENLLPKDCSSKLTLLVFTPKKLSFDLARVFKQSMKERNQKYALWGICLPNDIAIKSECFDNGDFCIEWGVYAMSITGNCLHSFSTVIDCRMKKRKFNRKIRKFREQLRLKRDSVGLACGPTWIRATMSDDVLKGTYRNCEEVMCFVKTVFPDIPISSVYLMITARLNVTEWILRLKIFIKSSSMPWPFLSRF